MKILQVIPHLGSGGAERFVVDLSNELCKMGHNVILCTLYDLEGSLGFYQDDVDRSVTLVQLGKRRGLSLKTMFKFAELVRSEKPDIINSHINALNYSALSQVLHSNGFHTVHSEARKEASGFLPVLLRRLVFGLGWITPVTISKESHASFKSFYHVDAVHISNGRTIGDVDVSQSVKEEIDSYKRGSHSRVIVQLARFQQPKNIPMMARVAHRLCDDGYDFALLFIGNTDNREILEQVERCKPDCAFILGERHNPLEYLKEAGCFALSSSYEGMPISLIEALGVGSIPVCTPAGGVIDAVKNGFNGILSKDFSEDSYYEALKTYLDMSEDSIRTMKSNALESYEPYSMGGCAERYVDAYKERIDRK